MSHDDDDDVDTTVSLPAAAAVADGVAVVAVASALSSVLELDEAVLGASVFRLRRRLLLFW